jgi:hypothetical protein
MPTGLGNRAYFPPLPCVWEALRTPGALLVVTEGIFKALASTQAGVPCIGLMGMQNWQLKRMDKGQPRRLIPDLAGIDWRGLGLHVLIVCDADPARKPMVHHGAAELARVLTDMGATAYLPRLPPVKPRDLTAVLKGQPLKQAIDDFIVAHGEEAYRHWIEQMRAERRVVSLAAFRDRHRRQRLGTLGEEGVFLDTAPTGVGKSYSDIAMLRQLDECGERSVTLLPSHRQGYETAAVLQAHRLDAVPLPVLDGTTCARWDEARAVISRGLSAPVVLCPDCPFREGCDYRSQRDTALAAAHAIATQARAVVRLSDLVEDRSTILLHETPLDVLRPTWATSQGFQAVATVARTAAARAVAGVWNHGEAAKTRNFYLRLARIAVDLDGWHHGSNEPAEIPLPEPARHVPENYQKDLNEAIIDSGVTPPGEALRCAVAATLGELSFLGVAIDERPAKDNKVKIVREIVAGSRTDLPRGRTIILSDATADPDEVALAARQPLRHITPAGSVALRHPVVQIIPERDVTKGRGPKAVAPTVRGLLYDLPHYRRVGLLTHQHLAKAFWDNPDLLGDACQRRLALLDYFGSGLSRGSNEWIQQCDVLLVLGTPRVGVNAIRQHLFRIGKRRAAVRRREEIGWGWDYWSGVTQAGKRVTVRTPHYTDHDWHAAYQSVVRGELLQSIGRARAILPEGIPCYVVTTENLAPVEDGIDARNGFPLAEAGAFAPLTEVQARVLGAMRRDGRRHVCTAPQIGTALGLRGERVRRVLNELVRAGRVRRAGKKWLACPRPAPNFPPSLL